MYQQVTGFIADQVIGEKFSKYFESKENSWQRIRADIHLGKVSFQFSLMHETSLKFGKNLMAYIVTMCIIVITSLLPSCFGQRTAKELSIVLESSCH